MKHIKPIKGVWPVLLICLLLSAVLCGVCGVLRLVVLRADTYMRAVEIPSVRREMYQAIREDLELQCRQYAMPWENVSGGISDEALNECTKAYFSNYVTVFLSGGEVTSVTATFAHKDEIVQAIAEYAAAHPESIYAQESENVTLLADFLQTRIETQIGVLSQPFITTILQRAAPYIALFNQLSGWFETTLLVFGTCLVLSVLYLILAGGKRRFYACCMGMTFLSLLFFLPSLMLYFSHLPNRLVLDAGVLHAYMVGIWDTVFDILTLFFGVLFLVCFLLFVFSAVRLVYKTKPTSLQGQMPQVLEGQKP